LRSQSLPGNGPNAAALGYPEGLWLGLLLDRVESSFSRRLEQCEDEPPLNLTRWLALSCLKNHRGVTQTRLARIADIDPSTLVGILDQLESDGLCTRNRDPRDRRCHRLYVTARAESVLQRLQRVFERTMEPAFAHVGPSARAEFLMVLERMYANLSSPPDHRHRVDT
jgi:MarR family transcriptional regulator, transcriptional regulator for hemolysin